MKKTLIFYKPEYADLAIKLRDNYRAHDHEEADIVSVEEHDDIESGYTNRLPVSDVFYNDPKPGCCQESGGITGKTTGV